MLYQINPNDPTAAVRLPVCSPTSLGVTEKHVEQFFACHLHELIPEDQLMLIGQERQRQEEADLFALDRKGSLYIFELKRWQSSAENLLQVMRYGQIFGRYDYQGLQDLARRHQKLEGELRERHQSHFDLEQPLPESRFNHDQVFVVVTNGVDRDTLDAISYWKRKGVRIDSLTYRLYSIAGQTHVYFDVYNPEQSVLLEENPGFYIVNTNATYMPGAWREMLLKQKASAFYDRKFAVAGIPKASTVYLYHTASGVIAKGKTTAAFKQTDCGGDRNEEFYVPLALEWQLDDPSTWRYAIKAWEINQEMGAGHRFRQTVFGISAGMAQVIDGLWAKRQASIKQGKGAGPHAGPEA